MKKIIKSRKLVSKNPKSAKSAKKKSKVTSVKPKSKKLKSEDKIQSNNKILSKDTTPPNDLSEKEITENHTKVSADLIKSEALLNMLEDLDKSNKKLQESEDKFRSIFDNVTVGILAADLKTKKFLFANPQIAKITGYSQNELAKMAVSNLHTKKYLPIAIKHFEKQAKGEELVAPNSPILRKDGKVIYCDISSTRHKMMGKDLLLGIFTNVTEKKKAEEELKESEDKYRFLVSNIDEVIYSAHPKTLETTFVNGSVSIIWGYSPKEWLDNPRLMLKSIHPADKKDVMKQIATAIKKKQNSEVEYRIVTKKKQIKWVRDKFNLVQDLKGKIVSIVGIVSDITQRKKVSLIIKRSERKFRRLFETAQDGIIILNAKAAQIEDINPFLLKLLGYRRKELINKKLWSIGPVKNIAETKKQLKAVFRMKSVRYKNLPLKTKRGKLVEVEVVCNRYPVGEREVIQCNIRKMEKRKKREMLAERSVEELESMIVTAYKQMDKMEMTIKTLKGKVAKNK